MKKRLDKRIKRVYLIDMNKTTEEKRSKYPKYFGAYDPTQKQAQEMADKLITSLGLPHVHVIYCDEEHPEALALYHDQMQTIQMFKGGQCLRTLIHEIAHHLQFKGNTGYTYGWEPVHGAIFQNCFRRVERHFRKVFDDPYFVLIR
jgi:hypothetical protein